MSLDTSATKLGLRERKKQQTRDTIARAALKLFAERGYDETTLAEIADAADVSPRTIFAYFECKEDILFCEEPKFMEMLRQRLTDRPPGTTTADALREFVVSLPPPSEEMKLRKQVVMANPSLHTRMRARQVELAPLLTESIAKDLGSGPDDIRARLATASVLAAFESVRDRLEGESGEPVSREQVMGILDEVLDFLRGGLAALQDREPQSSE